MGAALLVCRLALAGVFATAGVAKLADRGGTRRALAEFGVPERFGRRASALLPAVELAVAAVLIPSVTARAGAIAAAGLLAAFTAAIAAANARGRAPECHCFGQFHSAPAGRAALIRNACLLALAVVVAARGTGDSAPVAAAAAVILVAAVAAAAAITRTPRAVTKHGPHFGLAVGTSAPAFELEDAAGKLHSLSSLLTGVPRLVLVFTDSTCTTCHAMLPEIAHMQRRSRDTRVAIVASGDRERNRAEPAELMLLQRDREVARAYRVPGTPMAVVIDADGRIERQTLAGPDAIVSALAELTPGNDEPATLGDPIPDLVLPDPGGRRLALRELYRDPTIIVFWDPGCEFSRQMLPGLSAFEREAAPGAPGLIVISADAPPDQTFTSPVLLDLDGRARAAFGASGTPMAVLLSEDQVASPVAAGARTVFNLIDAATLAPH